MINGRFASSIIRPNSISRAAANVAHKPDMTTRFLKNKWVGKVCEAAAENPVLTSSLFSLAICCGARPITNYATTPNKKDAGYASCHSISSGTIGTIWALAIATPLAAAVGLVLKKPQKFLKPEVIKKFYPSVGIEEVMQNGKKVKKVMTNAKGELIRQDGSVLMKGLEPLKIKNADAAKRIEEINEKLKTTKKQAKIDRLNAEKVELEQKLVDFHKEKEAFEAANPNLYVDKNGVARSKDVLKTKEGKYQIDEDGSRSLTGKAGDKIGCAVLGDKTPITEEIEYGANKEKNITEICKWAPDILLAPFRAALTIKMIPPLLKMIGVEKSKKPAAGQTADAKNQTAKAAQTPKPAINKPSPFAGLQTHIASNAKKGGV